jgi:phosphohistidine phosphatase SixA
MMQRRITSWSGLLLLAVGLCLTGDAQAQQKSRQELVARFTGPQIVEKLKKGGHVLLLRHMTTVRSPDQWGGVDYEDCATQRVLSDVGKQQARTLGEAFKRLNIPVGTVYVSPYCRCRETALLAFGKEGTESETLTVWDELEMSEKTQRGTEIRKMLDTQPAAGTNTILVTHTGNLLWSFGLDSKPEGLTHVFKPTGLSIGRASYLGRVNPDEWQSLAGLDAPVADAPAPDAPAAEAPTP